MARRTVTKDDTGGGNLALGLAGGPSKFARGYAWTVIRLRWLIVLLWIVGAVAALTQLEGLESQGSASADALVASNSEALATQARSYAKFGTTPLAQTAVVQRNPRGLSGAAQHRVLENADLIRNRRDPVLKDIAADLPLINTSKAPGVGREQDTTAIHFLLFDPKLFIGQQSFLAHQFAIRHLNAPDDALVGVTGVIPARVEQERDINDALPVITAATIGLILIVLLLTLRSVAAPLLTLFCAGIAYIVAGRVIVLAGKVGDVAVPRELEPLIVVLLLGIVTDYCIFFLSDMRERLLHGATPRIAAERTIAKVAPIVLTAGLIVAAGTATLAIGTMQFFKAVGPGLALTALVGVLVALTLVPALMAIGGRRLFWPGVTRHEAEMHERWRAHRDLSRYGFLRRTVARATSARASALLIVVACVAGLGYGGYQLSHTRLGLNLIRGLPSDSEARRAADAAGAGFTPGIIAPTEVLLEGSNVAGQVPQLIRLQQGLERQRGVAGVVGPRESTEVGDAAREAENQALAEPAANATLSRDRTAARFFVVLQDDPFESNAIDDFHALRSSMPGLLKQVGLSGVTASFGGQTALSAETVDEARDNLLRLAVAALFVNLVFLIVFLRSIIAPLYLLGASVLALGASLGATTWVFQDYLGYGEVAYYIPFAAAVLLLSLGSDYNIFVVGRIWDEARKRPVDQAVRRAGPEAAGPITIAGLVLAGSFALLALIPLVPFRQFAFAMSAGVLIDSFVVRSLLAPSLITVVGRRAAPDPVMCLPEDQETPVDDVEPAETDGAARTGATTVSATPGVSPPVRRP